MTHQNVHVRELAAWGLDNYSYRPDLAHSSITSLAGKTRNPATQALLAHQTTALQPLLHPHSLRPDLLEEMHGLQWSLGVVDLRALIAFQRRLFFDPTRPPKEIPAAHDWNSLIGLCFAPAIAPQYTSTHDAATNAITIRSTNPNVHVRTGNELASPFRIHAGGPFFEVASFRNRWFLRDGYHRAYALLRAGINEVPSVIVHAKTIHELGAVQPWFFTEDTLFADNPPFVSDFLDDAMVLTYNRPPLIRTIRITIEQSLSPASPTGETS
ncbi:MAG: hypothetical protein HIU91_08915 [Acidobacteria bacterium]|nr:hypothetical protein [Acidobacteriota bacterium]